MKIHRQGPGASSSSAALSSGLRRHPAGRIPRDHFGLSWVFSMLSSVWWGPCFPENDTIGLSGCVCLVVAQECDG